MTLREIAGLLDRPRIHGDPSATVTAIADDSASVQAGTLFIAVKGLRRDGYEFVGEAFRRGAVGAVIEEARWVAEQPAGPCVIGVPDSRAALRRIATAFYGEPTSRLKMVGITGTNGKTTTSYLIQAILAAAGMPAGVIGTVGYRIGERQLAASHTTPGLLAVQRLLAGMAREGLQAAVMEVSSHALAQGRVEGCAFDVAVFTNLTQDHLDFHGTMDNYFAAKRTLFTGLADGRYGKPGAWAVVNHDDPWGRRLVEINPTRTLSYGLESGADVTAADVMVTWSGVRAMIQGARGTFPIDSPLVGRYNVPNLLAAVGTGLALGCDPTVIQAGIRQMEQVPGRFEKVEEQGQPFRVIVDYAHTDDALRRLLSAVRELQRGRVIVVFGCGGDRDRGKRPKMGRVAAELADVAVLTSDNPRSEEPQDILHQIESGVKEVGPAERRLRDYRIVEDRKAAIGWAIAAARPDDAVVIAGKGHEDYQIIGTTRHPFDDRLVAREALQQRMSVA